MRFSSARFITLCQQAFATAVVLTVGVSAAGVTTLDIAPERDDSAQQAVELTAVDAAPVTPEVREVRVEGIAEKAPGAPRAARGTKRVPAETGSSQPLAALSAPQPVTGYATVGVTWKPGVELDEDQVAVQVRTEKDGEWSEWIDAEYHDEHGPDSGSPEAQAAGDRPGTDALVIGDVDQVQMRAGTQDGQTPPGLKLAVVDPGEGDTTLAAPAIDTAKLSDATGSAAPSPGVPPAPEGSEAQETAVLSAMKVAPKPRIYSRAQWGADERMREQTRPSYGTVKAGFIHHTVNANDYTAAQVPALLRGIYAYHTQSRGWRDIGYNYLVDRFGRIWEGRYGGVDRAVIGAHTGGYNGVSFAMSAIGNFDIARPPQAVLSAYARLFAWKLSRYDIRANAPRVYVRNRWLPAVSGHRDAGSTACPGRYLYAELPAVRTMARRLQLRSQATPITRRWRAIGGHRSVVGSHRGPEYSVAGGHGRLFETGRIYAKGGVAYEIHGKVLRVYKRLGAASSRLGFPRTAPIRYTRRTVVRFEHGKIKVFRSGRVKVKYYRR